MELTLEQQEMVENNHNLIYDFCKRFNYSLDEYYDLCAIGLCKAVMHYNEVRGKFSTFAYRCMHNEIGAATYKSKAWKSSKNLKTISFDEPLHITKEGKPVTVEDMLDTKGREVAGVLDIEEAMRRLNKLNTIELKVLVLYMQGYSNSEVSEILGLTLQSCRQLAYTGRKKYKGGYTQKAQMSPEKQRILDYIRSFMYEILIS